jgi:hypothetical protein
VRTISIEVRPLGGDSFKVAIDEANPTVSEVKAEIMRVHGTLERLQELYKVAVREDGRAVREDDAEPELLQHDQFLSDQTIVALSVKEDPVVWRNCAEDAVVLSEGGAVALKVGFGWTLVTSAVELASGRHYWEVELVGKGGANYSYVGVARPNLNPKADYGVSSCSEGWFADAFTGGLWGNGKANSDRAGAYAQGDRVGVLLDLDDGSLLFFKNGMQHGSGYPAGSVAGPVVHAMQLYGVNEGGRAVPFSVFPAGHRPKK